MRVAEGRALRRISRCFPCMRRPLCGLALAWATKGRGPATKSKPAGHHCNDARVGEFSAIQSVCVRLCNAARKDRSRRLPGKAQLHRCPTDPDRKA